LQLDVIGVTPKGKLMIEEVRSSVHIRKAVPDDSGTIAAVLLSAFTEYESLYTAEAFAATTPSSDQILARLAEGPIWVALKNDAVVGTISAVPKREGLYLRGMAIAPAGQGEGIGRKLLEYAEALAIQRGCERLLLSTTPFLTRAIRLYEQNGYCRSDEGPHDLFGTPLFTMSKTLRRAKE
jgi:GNAT superfamily N-acetyltransferase